MSWYDAEWINDALGGAGGLTVRTTVVDSDDEIQVVGVSPTVTSRKRQRPLSHQTRPVIC